MELVLEKRSLTLILHYLGRERLGGLFPGVQGFLSELSEPWSLLDPPGRAMHSFRVLKRAGKGFLPCPEYHYLYQFIDLNRKA